MKSRTLSIFLLKNNFNAENALKKDCSLKETPCSNLPEKATVFLSNRELSEPWWKTYLGIGEKISQGLQGAILFLPCGERTFAITFGNAYHNLREESYEYDFGLLVTLNSVDKDALKSTDIFQPENDFRQRLQTPKSSDLTFFDFDRDSSIIKRLTGSVKEECKKLFSNVTGANNLRITTKKSVSELILLCQELLCIYQKDDYKKSFPDLHNIRPIKDPEKLISLNAALIDKLKLRSDEIILTVPDIIDYSSITKIKFLRNRNSTSYDRIDMSSFYQDPGVDLNSISLDDLRCKYEIILLDDNGQERDGFSLFRSLIWDYSNNNGEVFHLCDGNWYQVEKKYLDILQKEVDRAFKHYALPDYPIKGQQHDNEGEYNTEVSKQNKTLICLDKSNIAPNGQKQVEPCDLFTVDTETALYIHVKKGTNSSSLSHLFNQGVNSITLINSVDESTLKMENLIRSKIGSNDLDAYLSPVRNKKSKVIFAIISNKDPKSKSQALPLFSRISLKRAIQSLKSMNVCPLVTFIKDTLTK